MPFIDPKDYYKNLPKKRVAVGALIFNDKKEILVVKPSYRDYWIMPGGVVEKSESLSQALSRELKEELSLIIDIKNINLAIVDYRPEKFEDNVQKDDSLQIVFDCGVINEDIIKSIKIDNDEIVDYRFLPIEESLKIISNPTKERLKSYFSSNKAVYLNDGSLFI